MRYLRKRGKLCDNHEFVRVFNSNLYFYNDVIYIRRYVNGISVANAFYSQTRRVFLFANVSNFYSNCSKYNITHNAKQCNREPPYKHILYEFMVRTSIHVYVCINCAYSWTCVYNLRDKIECKVATVFVYGFSSIVFKTRGFRTKIPVAGNRGNDRVSERIIETRVNQKDDKYRRISINRLPINRQGPNKCINTITVSKSK